ncbi:MAG: hypothetical protein OEY00_07115, partial [Gammaproteobacteria bacterium]|nr:hypothetical protein [Gammaproteobacteria bacterium]
MKNFLCVFILGFIVTTKPVQAGSWFVGASTLLVETDTGITHILGNATIEEESAGYKVFFGWEIIDNLSIEGFYADYGDFVLTGNRGAIVLIGGDYYSFNANNVKSTTSTTG